MEGGEGRGGAEGGGGGEEGEEGWGEGGQEVAEAAQVVQEGRGDYTLMIRRMVKLCVYTHCLQRFTQSTCTKNSEYPQTVLFQAF